MSGRSSLALFSDREFLALASTAFARSQAYSTILIALALYANLFQTTGTIEGLFGTAYALAQFVIILPLGRAIDLGNSKRFLLVGLLINVGVFVGFSLVGTVEHVILVRVVQGIGPSILWITGSAVVGEISPDDASGFWFGSYNQVAALSSLAGDIFGGLLLYVYGFQVTYAVLIAVTLVATVMVFLFLRDDPGGRASPAAATGLETFRQLIASRAIRALVTFRLSFSFGKMAVIIFLPIYAITEFGLNPFIVGGILAGGKVTKALLQGLVGGWTDAIGRRDLFILGGALTYAIGTAMIPVAEFAEGVIPDVTVFGFFLPGATFVLFGAYGILGVGDSLRLPASMAMFVEEGEPYDAVAGSMSLRSISWKVGQIIGPLTVGALWDATSVIVAFLAAAGVILVSALVFFWLYRADPNLLDGSSPA